MAKRLAIGSGVVVVAGLLAWTVWPTMYRYHEDVPGLAPNERTIARENRFSGRTELLIYGKWVAVDR